MSQYTFHFNCTTDDVNFCNNFVVCVCVCACSFVKARANERIQQALERDEKIQQKKKADFHRRQAEARKRKQRRAREEVQSAHDLNFRVFLLFCFVVGFSDFFCMLIVCVMSVE